MRRLWRWSEENGERNGGDLLRISLSGGRRTEG
jgi:hypothetical protein